jgi:putative membrane protein
MNNQRIASIKALSAAAAIIFAIGLHPARANAQAGGAPTDPQIVGIVEAADQIDIDYAKLAESKAKHKQVKDFARQMITDHSAVQKAVRELAAKLNVTPADSETSNSLKTQAHQIMQKLHGLKGKEFEKAYVDNEVAYHKAVINATKSSSARALHWPQDCGSQAARRNDSSTARDQCDHQYRHARCLPTRSRPC